METLGALLEEKGRRVYSVAPEESALGIARILSERHIGAVLVMEGDEVLGIVSERDLTTRVLLKGTDPRLARAREILTADPVVADTHTGVREAMAIMTRQRCRHLPVFHQGKLAGIVSIGDLTRSVSRDQEFTLQHLQEYILDHYPR